MKNNKGVSIIGLVITIIVIIILAGIVINGGTESIDKANQAAFQNEFKDAVEALNIYNTRAVIRKNNKDYEPEKLNWDGKSERAENTARVESPDEEDTIKDILKDSFTKTLENKIYILDGKIYVFNSFETEKGWAAELYSYINSGD